MSGIRPSLTTLAPVIRLPPEIAESCKSGICKPKGISEETEQEYERTKESAKRYDMKLKRRVTDKEEERCEKKEKGCSVMGGKRRTKYVGTRRHKRIGTRRKV